MSDNLKINKYYNPLYHQTIPYDDYYINHKEISQNDELSEIDKMWWIYNAVNIEGIKIRHDEIKILVWTKVKKESTDKMLQKYLSVLNSVKYKITSEINDRTYFMFNIFIALVDIIEKGINIIWSGEYNSKLVKSHPNYINGKVYCMMAFETIKRMIFILTENYLYETPKYKSTYVVSNPDSINTFFHISIDKNKELIDYFNSLNIEDQMIMAKKKNNEMYVEILDLLTPCNNFTLLKKFNNFHNKLQINRYFNKLINNIDNPTYLPYNFNI